MTNIHLEKNQKEAKCFESKPSKLVNILLFIRLNSGVYVAYTCITDMLDRFMDY